MQSRILSWCKKVLGALGTVAALSGPAMAIPTLTTDASTAGFGLSQFAYNFPATGYCCGPLGIAFPGGGQVMVADYPGNVRIFPTDTDGQNAASIVPVISGTYGSNNTTGLARSGNFIYMTLQASGSVVRLNLDGTFNSTVVTGIPTATGIFANPVTGVLYVSDCCSSTGIWIVDPVTNTKSQFKTGSFDGLSVSADGTTIYAEIGGHIIGYKLSDGSQVFDSGFISGVDGTELGAGTLAGKIFANTNFGELWEIDIANPAVKVLLVAGGSRGDFVTADPNGSLLFTQTSDIWRLTAPTGGCIGAACNDNQVPEPSSLALMAVALLALSRVTRKTGRARRLA